MNKYQLILSSILIVCGAFLSVEFLIMRRNNNTQNDPNNNGHYIHGIQYENPSYPHMQYQLNPHPQTHQPFDQYHHLNTTYINPLPVADMQQIQYQNHNHSNQSGLDLSDMEHLLTLNRHPGNPRSKQPTINKYGTFVSTNIPDFPDQHFSYAKYGQDVDDDLYKGFFKTMHNKSKICDIKSWMSIEEVDIQSLAMNKRIETDKNITDNYLDVREIFPDNKPIPQSAKESNKGQEIKATIKKAIEDNVSPEDFRLKFPEIASNKNNKAWFQNEWDAKHKEQKEKEDEDAVDWLRSELTPMQKQLIQLVDKSYRDYNDKFNTSSKKILMGNRHVIVIVSPGNKGLTTAFKFMQMDKGTDRVMLLSAGGKTADVICNYHNQLKTVTNLQFLFWNIPKDGWKDFKWDSVEQISDGLTTTPKYLAATQQQAPPIFAVGTNKMFELKCPKTKRPYITLDRVKIYRARQTVSELQEIDVYDYYFKKYGDDLRLLNEEDENSDFDLKEL